MGIAHQDLKTREDSPNNPQRWRTPLPQCHLLNFGSGHTAPYHGTKLKLGRISASQCDAPTPLNFSSRFPLRGRTPSNLNRGGSLTIASHTPLR
jgi:hypothetical protein